MWISKRSEKDKKSRFACSDTAWPPRQSCCRRDQEDGLLTCAARQWDALRTCQVRKCVRCTEAVQSSRLPCFHFQPVTTRSLTNGIKYIVHIHHCAVWDTVPTFIMINTDKLCCTMILCNSMMSIVFNHLVHMPLTVVQTHEHSRRKTRQNRREQVLTTSCRQAEGCDLQVEIWNDNDVYQSPQDKTRQLLFALALRWVPQYLNSGYLARAGFASPSHQEARWDELASIIVRDCWVIIKYY